MKLFTLSQISTIMEMAALKSISGTPYKPNISVLKTGHEKLT